MAHGPRGLENASQYLNLIREHVHRGLYHTDLVGVAEDTKDVTTPIDGMPGNDVIVPQAVPSTFPLHSSL